LGRSGQLKRNNKSCCNRYIFLKRKFVQRFQQNLLREHLGGAAFLHHISLEAHSQLLLGHDGQQQQQLGQQAGVGSPKSPLPALTFVSLFRAPLQWRVERSSPTQLPSACPGSGQWRTVAVLWRTRCCWAELKGGPAVQ
ncbi:hypothetical protein CLOM_g8335, partial [Closterium sp. NIES-68]